MININALNELSKRAWNGHQRILYKWEFTLKGSFLGKKTIAVEYDANDPWTPYCVRTNGAGHYFVTLDECFEFLNRCYGKRIVRRFIDECKKHTTN